MNKNPGSLFGVTLSRSPSFTPDHQIWLNMTTGDSLGSCTHVTRVLESPIRIADWALGAAALKIDCVVLDRLRPLLSALGVAMYGDYGNHAHTALRLE